MSLPHALLGVLSARPMNGYELSKFFDSAAGWIWSAPQSQIYTTLRRMTDDGWISQEAQTRGTRMRTHVYSITEAGERELREWVATVHDLPSPRDTVLLQALFFDLVDADSAEKVVRAYIEEQESRIARWTGHRDALRARTTPCSSSGCSRGRRASTSASPDSRPASSRARSTAPRRWSRGRATSWSSCAPAEPVVRPPSRAGRTPAKPVE
ncbi:PadR family transcriptional regulator [Barrientosiimonas endolithica]|uniref:Transcription regulator PadR N-terminal domain-containing protein n=1 Tax=Barrientosiimonas endolithica TaxID=1535208 RepID=A0ABM8HDB0_9MICO|nr:PadR family transcriptional regulator [Barrientosiimonas endolithica]BDZ58966.1 hypothetical protein GCM10025872_26230 [Barrientosiimonas endolithica]